MKNIAFVLCFFADIKVFAVATDELVGFFIKIVEGKFLVCVGNVNGLKFTVIKRRLNHFFLEFGRIFPTEVE